jgi:hypothetical protein
VRDFHFASWFPGRVSQVVRVAGGWRESWEADRWD